MDLLEKVGLRPKHSRALVVERVSPMAGFELAGIQELGSTIDLRRDHASTLMAALFGAIALFLILSLWLGSFSKQETMRGSVTAASGAVRITSLVPGVVAKVWVAQGDTVKAGQKILTINPQQTGSGGDPLNRVDIAALEVQRANLVAERERTRGLLDGEQGDRLRLDTNADTLVSTLEAQAKQLEGVILLQRETVDKFRRYVKMGYATRQTLMGEEKTLLDFVRQLSDTRVQLAQASTVDIERQRTFERTSAETRNTTSTIDSEIEAVDAKIERLRAGISMDILAPKDGQVATFNVREGDVTELGQVVAALTDPGASLRVTLEAPSSAIGLVEIGQRVVLKYDAFPYKTFGIQHGTVVRIGEAPLLLPKTLDPGTTTNPLRPAQSTFIVEVEPEKKTISAYGVERPILIGSTLSADVVVERRALIDWVLDPILAVKGHL